MVHTKEHTHDHARTGPDWLMNSEGTLSSPYVLCHIVMPQFSQHKRDDDIWFSQPFYSAPGGYKLCLRVDANGSGYGKGTYVSMAVCLMKGENDHQLQWPFEHNVTYGILNWKRDENHVIHNINFKKAGPKCKARVTLTEMAGKGSGHFQFLSHSSVYDSSAANIQYLHEDRLCVQVLKVEPPK